MNNIYFKIGQPNTGKSHGFKKEELLKDASFSGTDIEYKVIPVSGGVGNEYKGLQNTDLALSYDVINKTIRFGDFLKILMSAIIQPGKPHIVFLDDFHNQDISSLLSEYTPLFKGQQKVDLTEYEETIKEAGIDLNLLNAEEFETVEHFIAQWNTLISRIKDLNEKIVSIPITNRISGSSLELIFPSNFYLLGAANFNEKTMNIFSDWNDRAEIDTIDPIKTQERAFKEEKDEIFMIGNEVALEKEDAKFIKCCLSINTNLQSILEDQNIFDHRKYCFGIWKVVGENGNIVSKDDRIKVVKFFFSMIKNSLIYNNKNSEINTIGWKLIVAMKNDDWFTKHMELSKEKIEELEKLDINDDQENGKIFKLLHTLNIYDN
jgi:hypothetical protein